MNSSLVFALALLSGSPTLSPKPQGVPVINRSPIPLPAKPSAPPKEDPMRTVEAAKKAITGFFSASSVAEMSGYVRNPKQALPRIKAHHGDKKLTPVRFAFGTDFSEVDWNGKAFVLTRVDIAGDETFICVEVPPKGDAKVDWESYVGWSEVSWTDFVKSGSQKPLEFRVALSKSDYFNFSFTDSGKYVCFRLTDKDDSETIYAYCGKDSEIHRKLIAALAPPTGESEPESQEKHITCTLKLSMKADDVPHRQAVIESFLREGWVDP